MGSRSPKPNQGPVLSKQICLCKFRKKKSIHWLKQYHFKNESAYDLENKVKVTKTKSIIQYLCKFGHNPYIPSENMVQVIFQYFCPLVTLKNYSVLLYLQIIHVHVSMFGLNQSIPSGDMQVW